MFTFELVTLSGLKFSEEVYEVMLPTEDGQIAVFPHHMPLVSIVVPGIVSIRRNQNDKDNQLEQFAVHGGVIDIDKHRLRVLVDEADKSEDVLESEAQEALEKAKQLAKEAPDDQSLEEALNQVTLQQSRLRIAELKSKHRTSKKKITR